MKQVLLGFRAMSFKGVDGEQVEGLMLYTRFPSGRIDVGEETAHIFADLEEIPTNINDYVGKEIEVKFHPRSMIQLEFPSLDVAGASSSV